MAAIERDEGPMADKITAYKFLSSKHVDNFVSNGVLRLGAAGEFRKIEGTTGGRGDENELRAIWHADGRYELKTDDPFIVALAGAPIPAACNMPKLVIQGGPGVFINMDADGLLYCASSEVTPELAARMKSDFDADACVRISNFDEFIRLVATHPEVTAASWQASPVKYVHSKLVKRFTGLDPFEKEQAFGWQKEIRGLFQLASAPKEGKLITAPSIVHLLKREF
jgi:hypothetical protein